MSIHRCPVHDLLFESVKPPTQDGHKKCPGCNPPPEGKEEKAKASGPAEE